MYESVVPSVLKKYGIKYRKICDFQKGYRNEVWPVLTDDGQKINVTFFKSEPNVIDRINRADKVSGYLHDVGMPVRRRIEPKLLILDAGTRTVHIGVYNYLLGDTIPWEAYTMKHLKSLGHVMGDMHHYLHDLSECDLPSVYDEYLLIIDKMRRYFNNGNIVRAVKDKLNLSIDTRSFDKYEKILDSYGSKDGQQPLHMDFVRGNILFDKSDIVGVLDFEKTARGHVVVDISRTLAFLLVDCKYKSPEKINKYFLRSGYQKRGKNKDIGNHDDLAVFVEMFLVYDFYKFLAHNPYESLRENEHFARTRDILAVYGVIS